MSDLRAGPGSARRTADDEVLTMPRAARVGRRDPSPDHPPIADSTDAPVDSPAPAFRLSTMNRLAVVAISSSVLGLIGSVTGTGPVAIAADPSGPTFLEAEQWQLVAGPDAEWESSPVYPGRRATDFACAAEPLPQSRSTFRNSFGSDFAGGTQHVVRQPNAAAAIGLVERYLTNLRSCQKRQFGGDGGPAQVRTLGSYRGLGDGLTVIGVFYRLPAAGPVSERVGTNLFGIGRDGRTVTTMELNVLGPKSAAPIEAFTALAKRGVSELQ